MMVGRSFCNMLAVCDQTGDIRRAGQWSEAADRWCAENDHGPYPGVCRIFKAELLWHKGEWVRAESEVMRASTELGMLTDVIGEAWYQYGEMRLRVGDDTKAERPSRMPLPGAVSRCQDVPSSWHDAETSPPVSISTLRSPGLTPWARARILPALIQLALEAGEVGKAETAVDELSEIGRVSRSELFAAQARAGAGRIALARGDQLKAIDALREALRTFTALGLPFEAALAHADLATAYRDDGAGTLADMELRTALAEFERLGVVIQTGMIAASTE